jgi:hypothetical protein
MRRLPPAVTRTRVVPALAVVVVGLSLSSIAGGSARSEEPSASSAQQPEQFCTWRAEDQPDAPLELNLVGSRDLAKTIAMQKEIFGCFVPAGGVLRQVGAIDVETFIELVQRSGRRGIRTVARRVSVAACTKRTGGINEPPIRIACVSRPVKLGTLPTPFPGCAFTRLPRDPVVMDTLRLRSRDRTFVKTVKLEKKILDCDNEILDVFVFTKVVERQRDGDFVPVSTTFNAIACAKERTTRGAVPRVRCARIPTN